MNFFLSFFRKRKLRNNTSPVVQFQRAPLPERKKIPFRHNGSFKIFRRYSLVFLGLTAFFVLFILIISPVFRVQNIEVERKNLSTDISSIESFLAEKTLSQSIVFLSSANLEQEMHKEFPQWKAIHLQKHFPNTLIASVESFSPFATVKVRREIEQTIKGEKTPRKTLVEEQYIINERGDISYPDLTDKPTLTIVYNDTAPKNLSLGTKLIPFDAIQKMQYAVQTLLGSYDLASKEITYYYTAQEIHISVFQFYLWIDLRQNIDMQLNKLKEGLGILKKNKLEYIDLRISNRIIYKEKP